MVVVVGNKHTLTCCHCHYFPLPFYERRHPSVTSALALQQVEGHTPTVTHRSVRGRRARDVGGGQQQKQQQQHVPRFDFDHQERFPAPADSSSWRLGPSASRVFEVWGGSAEGLPEGNGGAGQAEALLGLAKVSLRPFAAFGNAGREVEEEAAGAAAVEGSKLAVAADGPVVVVDPFSGRTVGELCLYLALGASSAIAALPGPKSGGGTAAVANERAVGKEGNAADGGVGMGARLAGGLNEGELEAEERPNWKTEQKETAGGENGTGALLTDQEPPALDDSLAGEISTGK